MKEIPPIKHWDVSADLLPLGGGHRNIAYRTVGLPQDLVFKSTRRQPDAMEWLLPVQDLARKAGLIVPHIVRSCRGNLVEAGWTCEEFIEGRPFATNEAPCIRTRIQRFHSLAAKVPQRPGQVSAQDLLETCHGGDLDLDTMPQRLVDSCRVSWRALAGHPGTIVHGDLNPGNMIRCPNGDIALIDWDECRRDVSLFDTGQQDSPGPSVQRALLAWEVACSWKLEPDHAKELAGML